MAGGSGGQRRMAAGDLAPLSLDGNGVTVLCGGLCLLPSLWPGFSASCLGKRRLRRAASRQVTHLIFTASWRMLSLASLLRNKGSLTAGRPHSKC